MNPKPNFMNRTIAVILVVPFLCIFLAAEDVACRDGSREPGPPLIAAGDGAPEGGAVPYVRPEVAAGQESTVFVDDFETYPVQTLARGCGDMSSGAWRWGSHHHIACYSAGWGVEYGRLSANTTSDDKQLRLWGGVPFGGGGDCTATLYDQRFQELSDYAVTAVVSPVTVVNGIGTCKSGMVGIAGRVQGTSTFCTGYLLALSLNNGEAICGDGSYLELYRNDRGVGCNGSEGMTLLGSVEVGVSADLGGYFPPGVQYVMKLCFTGSEIYGSVWTLEGWESGGSEPLAEVMASDDAYLSGTVGLYQGSAHTLFDDVVVEVGAGCVAAAPMAMEAELDFDPNTLNVRSTGRYVTCYVELPAGYDPREVDVATLMLNDLVPAESKPTEIGDNDDDGVPDLMVKFSRAAVIDALAQPDTASVLVAPGPGGTSGGAEWSLQGAANEGGTSGGAEWSWDAAASPGGTSGGAEWSTQGAANEGGTSDGARLSPDKAAVEVEISGGGKFSWNGAVGGGGTSGGEEYSWNGMADGSRFSEGGESGLGGSPSGSRSWRGDDPSGTSGGSEVASSGSPDHGDTVEVWVGGELIDGTAFVGRDTIRVTNPGNGSGKGNGSGEGQGSGNGSGSGGGVGSGPGPGEGGASNQGSQTANSSGPAGTALGSPGLVVTPSPVKGRARLSFEVAIEGHVSLSVFDAAGRRVATLVSGTRGVGTYDVEWDRTTDDGRRAAPGVYFVRLDQPGNTSMRKMMVVQ